MLTSIVNICLGIVLAIPTVSSDVDPIDRWKDYIYFKTNNFYLLEKQYYNQITCQINVPSIVAGWELGKEQLKKNKDVDFEFKEEFAKFTLHVHRYSVVTIERPKFDIRVVSNNASVNTQTIENEIQFINEDMQRQISDVAKVIEGYFDEQRLPKRTNVELKKLTFKGENVILNLTNEEMEREETYSDNYRNVVVKNHGTPVLERKDAYI